MADIYIGQLLGRIRSLPPSEGIKIAAARTRDLEYPFDGRTLYQKLFVKAEKVYFKVELELGPVTQTDHKIYATNIVKLRRPFLSHLPPRMIIVIWNNDVLEWYSLNIPAVERAPSRKYGALKTGLQMLAEKIYIQLGGLSEKQNGKAYQMILQLNTQVDPFIFTDKVTQEIICYEFEKLIVHTN